MNNVANFNRRICNDYFLSLVITEYSSANVSFIGTEESLSSPITSPPTSPCMPPFTPCYVQELLDSASSSVESDCDNSILDDSLASSNDSDFDIMNPRLNTTFQQNQMGSGN